MPGNFASDFSDTNSELFDQKKILVTDTGVEAITDTTSTKGRECRQFVRIFNTGPNRLYWGPAGVTSPAGSKPGEELRKHQTVVVPVQDKQVRLITATSQSATVIVTDLG